MTHHPAVEAHDVVKTYTRRGQGPVQALDGIDLSVPAGIVYGLLGPNGAGKSTLTKILTTLSTPTAGRAAVAGHDVVREGPAVRAAIGYVSQGRSADPLLTALENLTMAARIRGMAPRTATARGRELLEQFGLDPDNRTAAGKLSGGQRRKLDVAVGLIHAPSVLFLDEPTTGLDPEARASMWTEIRRLSRDGQVTVLLTTHYLDEADELADRIGILDRGRMVTEGTPDELKAGLDGDAVTVELVEPDPERVRAVAGTVGGLRGIVVEAQGTRGILVARTDDVAAAVGRLITALEAGGIAFGAVAASRPSLEDVYLHWAGRTYSSAHLETPAGR